MTLKIVSNDFSKEVHSVRIDDGVITVIAVEDGADVTVKNMEKNFPNFQSIIETSTETSEILGRLEATNSDYIWAHVSGKL